MSDVTYTPPTVAYVVLQKMTVLFTAVIGIGARATLVCGPIPFRYKVNSMETTFGPLTTNLFYQWLVASRNGNAYSSEPPPDMHCFARFSPSTFLAGENVIRRLPVNFVAGAEEKYLKLHVFNGSAVAQGLNASVEIEEVTTVETPAPTPPPTPPTPTGWTLTIEQEGEGTVTPPPGTYTAEENEWVEILAEPASGWKIGGFSSWATQTVYGPAIGQVKVLMKKDCRFVVRFVREEVP